MTKTIKTKTDLEKEVMKVTEEILEKVSKEVISLFKEKYIMKYVYNSHGGNSMYYYKSKKPTYDFLNAWEFTEIRRSMKSLSTELRYTYDDMRSSPETFLHGSIYWNKDDVRDVLMAILNKEGHSSSLWLSVSRPVAYWNKFLEDMMEKKMLQQIIDKHFKAAGFSRVK